MQADFLRYSCQIALPGFSETSQKLLQQAKVLIVGAGGLGCPVAQYLAASGIGTLAIADFDTVSVSNLHRQILFNEANVGFNKAELACKRLQMQNPYIQLVPYTARITSFNVTEIIDNYDVIVDCTDNFETRYLLNDAAVITGKPVVYGAIYQFEGQVAVWNVVNTNGTRSPNYRDLFPQVNAAQIPNCSEGGVIPTLAGIIGCMQANEVIKYITGTGELLAGKVLVFDAQSMQSRIIKIGHTTKTSLSDLQQTTAIPTITTAELKKGLNNNSLQLIDVRTEQERDAFDIGGLHIPLDDLSENIHQITGDKTWVVYCASGKRSEEAVRIISKSINNAKVFSLQGGLKSWMEL